MGITTLITLSLLCAALVSADECQFNARSNDVFNAANFKADTLSMHNQYRSDVGKNLDPLTWSDSLASLAQEWANRCDFNHREGDDMPANTGENLYQSSGYSVSVIGKFAVCSWNTERHDYDYGSNHCSNVCGHYTQIVWRDTKEVGCGHANCGGDVGDLVVCNYAPAGNVNVDTTRPY